MAVSLVRPIHPDRLACLVLGDDAVGVGWPLMLKFDTATQPFPKTDR